MRVLGQAQPVGRGAGALGLALPRDPVDALDQLDLLARLERVGELVLAQVHRHGLGVGRPHLGHDLERLPDLDLVGQVQADHADLLHLVLGERPPRQPHAHLLGAVGLADDVAAGLVAVGDDDHARQVAGRVQAVAELDRRLDVGAGAALGRPAAVAADHDVAAVALATIGFSANVITLIQPRPLAASRSST
ncbi:MAG: hypothetical protein IPL61_19130 [Myxococcales bacterium]|nr:hypothetical protein [Myxococcales bacterium]